MSLAETLQYTKAHAISPCWFGMAFAELTRESA